MICVMYVCKKIIIPTAKNVYVYCTHSNTYDYNTLMYIVLLSVANNHSHPAIFHHPFKPLEPPTLLYTPLPSISSHPNLPYPLILAFHFPPPTITIKLLFHIILTIVKAMHFLRLMKAKICLRIFCVTHAAIEKKYRYWFSSSGQNSNDAGKFFVF
jgi:hypothetical protein